MPLNVADAHYRSYQRNVLPECTRRGIGVLGMKALASGLLPEALGVSAEVCRRYVLSLPVSTLICGIRSRDDLKQDLAIARGFQPMSKPEIDELLVKTKEASSDGRHERFKTTGAHDGAYHRKQHGV